MYFHSFILLYEAHLYARYVCDKETRKNEYNIMKRGNKLLASRSILLAISKYTMYYYY